MSDTRRHLVPALTGRSTLVVFAALAIGAFLPGLVPALAPVLYPLVLPTYLVTMVIYDGGLLEQVVSLLSGTTTVDSGVLWDVGQALTLYLFTVAAALVGGAVSRRFGPERDDPAAGVPLRYVVAGGLLLVGLGLAARGIITQPMMTGVTCESSASAAGNATATAPPECARTTEPATGQRLYIVGLGVAVGSLGAGIVGVDRWLAARR